MTTEQATQERVVVSTFVALAPTRAFEIFTRDIDAWWKRAPRYRQLPGQAGAMRFEGSPASRLVEQQGEQVIVIGRVLTWEVGKRLTFEWHDAMLSAADRTTVDVRFEPHKSGTRVTLEHRNVGGLPGDHRVRRGLSGEAFEAMLGYLWADLLASYRLCSER